MELTWVDKSATKLPEALWLRFTPDTQSGAALPPLSLSPQQFALEAQKLGRFVDALDVVNRGSVNFFPADAMRLSMSATNVSVTVASLDAAFVGIGKPWPFPVRVSEQPEGAPDFSFNLFNNIWGTNYPQWFPWAGTPHQWADGANLTFRFAISLAGPAATDHRER